ncbi:MAG: hypothetical protein ACHQ2Y_05470 [Candidatus Lutacidiplasmatales archaeon]
MEDSGRWSAPAAVPVLVIGFYAVLILVLAYATTRPAASSFPYITELLAVILLLFLARMLSTRYTLDADQLHAWRLFGSRRVRLEEVRKIEFANLRDLGPISFIGSWGWRGRMWSTVVGSFDSIHTVSRGLLITAGAVPLFISPADPVAFARELSRRVRSYTGPLEVDVGAQRPANPSVF